MGKPIRIMDQPEAIRDYAHQYEIEGTVPQVVARLAGKPRALQALAAMKLSERQLASMLFSCVQAVENVQSFDVRLKKETEMLRRLEQLRQAVSEVKGFLSELSAPPQDSLSASLNIDDRDKRGLLGALGQIGSLIDTRERIAKQTPVRIGATRKSQLKVAAQNAGIGWLSASIRRITSKPHIIQTCILAEVIFDIREVSEGRQRGAYRNFTDRDWRNIA